MVRTAQVLARHNNETINGHTNRRVLSESWPISVAGRTHTRIPRKKHTGQLNFISSEPVLVHKFPTHTIRPYVFDTSLISIDGQHSSLFPRNKAQSQHNVAI